ncbi:MAG: hypothetical protein ACHREM_05440 [Polyangiales bacterium]
MGWSLEFWTNQIPIPFSVGAFDGAQGPNTFAGLPGIYVSGQGIGCDFTAGTFQVHDVTCVGGNVQSLLLTFEQLCGITTGPALRGCLRYSR